MSVYKKMCFAGGVGSGKSTIVRSLSEIEVVNTDKQSSVDIGKELTTVGIDYGRITLDAGMALGLYGVPGQRRYSPIWDHVNKALWGLAFLIRVDDELPDLAELAELISFFDPASSETPFVVALTHSEARTADDIELINDLILALLDDVQLSAAIMQVDCRDKKSAMTIPYYINSCYSLEG